MTQAIGQVCREVGVFLWRNRLEIMVGIVAGQALDLISENFLDVPVGSLPSVCPGVDPEMVPYTLLPGSYTCPVIGGPSGPF